MPWQKTLTSIAGLLVGARSLRYRHITRSVPRKITKPAPSMPCVLRASKLRILTVFTGVFHPLSLQGTAALKVGWRVEQHLQGL